MPPCGVWKLTAVPANNVDDVVAEFQLDSPTKIDKIDNHNGTFDVVATFPPCAGGGNSNQPDHLTTLRDSLSRVRSKR